MTNQILPPSQQNPIIGKTNGANQTFQQQELSEGEKIIALKLKKLNIKFRPQEKIEKLNYDNKAYRVADFYLSEYKVYLEFLGQWDDLVHRERYKEKKNIYYKNNIPTIFIYPDNIGAFEYYFDFRLQNTLIKPGKEKELRKYHLYKVKRASAIWTNVILFVLMLGILSHVLHKGTFDLDEMIAVIILIGITFYPIYRIYRIIQNIRKNDYSLDKLD